MVLSCLGNDCNFKNYVMSDLIEKNLDETNSISVIVVPGLSFLITASLRTVFYMCQHSFAML